MKTKKLNEMILDHYSFDFLKFRQMQLNYCPVKSIEFLEF